MDRLDALTDLLCVSWFSFIIPAASSKCSNPRKASSKTFVYLPFISVSPFSLILLQQHLPVLVFLEVKLHYSKTMAFSIIFQSTTNLLHLVYL
jgi:hypothetical protein